MAAPSGPTVRELLGELLLYLTAPLIFIAMVTGFAGEQLLSAFISALSLITLLFGILHITHRKA